LSHDAWTDRLSDYLDGAMSVDERGAFEAHLAACDECARALESLREIVARARSLPDRAPERDLWPEILSRLADGPAAPAHAPRRMVFRLPRHVHLTLPQALAAGFALVALSGGLMWWALRHESPAAPSGAPSAGAIARRASGAEPGAAPSGDSSLRAAPRSTKGGTSAPLPSGLSGPNDAASYAAYEAHYDQAIAELERTLQEHRAELDTSTVRVVEQDLVIIDHAIAQARHALEADPASPYLHQHLALQMKLKLDLLRRTAAFAGGQG